MVFFFLDERCCLDILASTWLLCLSSLDGLVAVRYSVFFHFKSEAAKLVGTRIECEERKVVPFVLEDGGRRVKPAGEQLIYLQSKAKSFW